MIIKSMRLTKLKAGLPDRLEDGEFEAYASTFSKKPDAYGDVVRPGAFAKTLGEWQDSGQALPILYGHDFRDPFNNLGHVVEAREDPHGLWVRGRLDLENPTAQQVYRLLKGRRLSQLSFAFETIDAAPVTLDDGIQAYELREVKIFEISLVPIGANQETEILAVKSSLDALLKSGRVISAKNESELRQAHESLGRVLSSLTADGSKSDFGQVHDKTSLAEIDILKSIEIQSIFN